MALVSKILDLDRYMMEGLDRFVLAIWNHLGISWGNQLRILTGLSVVFAIMPEFAQTHRLSFDSLWLIALAAFWQFMISWQTRDPEAHNFRLVSRFHIVWFGYRLFLWGLFLHTTYAIVMSKGVGIWASELGLILWFVAMFCYDTFIPTEPPQRDGRDGVVETA